LSAIPALVMPLNHQISRRPGIVVVHVRGQGTLDDLHRLIDIVAQATVGTSDKRVLVNLQQMDEQLKFTDHYSLGEQAARKLSHLDRLASVVPAGRRTGTSEKVANAQGMQLRVFVTEDEAAAWLCEGAPQR
jgi:hypothetical protein